MALWDTLGKKATDTTNKAVQQARTLTEINRLNGSIAEENRKIESLYYELGKAYAQKHHDDGETEFDGIMAAIRECEQQIEENVKQIRQLRGVVLCKSCGAEISKDAGFCSTCGTPVPKPEPVKPQASGNVCTKCGNVLNEGSRFCTACGTPVVAAPKPEVPRCPVCGTELEEGAVFCTECGAHL